MTTVRQQGVTDPAVPTDAATVYVCITCRHPGGPESEHVACGPALVDGARLLACATDGIMPWRGRPQPLKRGLIARVPPLNFEELE